MIMPALSCLAVQPIGGACKFEDDRREVVLSEVFEKMTEAKVTLGITAWSMTESTIEEVFLKRAALTGVFSSGAGITNSKAVVPLSSYRALAERGPSWRPLLRASGSRSR